MSIKDRADVGLLPAISCLVDYSFGCLLGHTRGYLFILYPESGASPLRGRPISHGSILLM